MEGVAAVLEAGLVSTTRQSWRPSGVEKSSWYPSCMFRCTRPRSLNGSCRRRSTIRRISCEELSTRSVTLSGSHETMSYGLAGEAQL